MAIIISKSKLLQEKVISLYKYFEIFSGKDIFVILIELVSNIAIIFTKNNCNSSNRILKIKKCVY